MGRQGQHALARGQSRCFVKLRASSQFSVAGAGRTSINETMMLLSGDPSAVLGMQKRKVEPVVIIFRLSMKIGEA